MAGVRIWFSPQSQYQVSQILLFERFLPLGFRVDEAFSYQAKRYELLDRSATQNVLAQQNYSSYISQFVLHLFRNSEAYTPLNSRPKPPKTNDGRLF